MAYHNVIISNLKLSGEEFSEVKSRIANYRRFIDSEDNKICYYGIDDTKTTYSVDAGAVVNELDAFLLAIGFYLEKYSGSLKIEVKR